MKTYNEIISMCMTNQMSFHHSASARGYIAAKSEPMVNRYNGRFGTGYTVEFPNKNGFESAFGSKSYSNNFHQIEYYIEN